MYLSFNAVHTPMHVKTEHLEKYKGHYRQKLAAMTWSLDENIGKIMSKLEEQGNLENTLIFFLSDNGGATTNNSLNGSLKGFKGTKFEAGHRVPFIVHWKGKINKGVIFDGLSSSLDIFKTSIDASRINQDENLVLDGVILLPYLKGEKSGDPHDKLFWRKLGKSAVRIGDDKLIRLDNYGSVLYNLRDDLGETQDLSDLDTKTFSNLTQELEHWEEGLIDPLWYENDFWLKRSFEIHKNLMLNKYRDVESMKSYNKKIN